MSGCLTRPRRTRRLVVVNGPVGFALITSVRVRVQPIPFSSPEVRMTPRHSLGTIVIAAALVLPLADVPRGDADPPKVLQLRTQKIGDATYFHVRLQNPSDLSALNPDNDNLLFLGRGMSRFDPLLMPRLVAQDGSIKGVYRRLRI